MPLDPRDPASLWDMLVAARKIVASIQDVDYPAYEASEELQLTVERRLEIIGEAATRVSQQFRNEHPEIPWRSIIAQRNVLAHAYDEIDNERIWRLVVERLPELIAHLAPLVPPRPDES